MGLNTTYTFNNLTLRHKGEYYVTVNVSNMVGLSTGVTSNGIKIDFTPPEPVEHMTGGSSNSDGVCNALFDSCNGETGNLPHFTHLFFLPLISYISIICFNSIHENLYFLVWDISDKLC